MRRALLLLASALLVVGVVLIATPAAPLAKNNPPPAPAAPKLPATIRGLAVTTENIHSVLAEDRRTLYVSGVWLYSLRQGKELMATVEIGKFKSDAPWRNDDFDLSLAGQLGNSVPNVARVDGMPVYITSARGLEIVAWFRHGYLTIIGIRSTYTNPKDLLRAVMGATP